MRVELLGGFYQARSIIAAAQRCVNLYPEVNQRESLQGLPQTEAPTLITHYPTPGLILLGAAPNGSPWRCAYRASTGAAYGVVGTEVYAISSTWAFTALGSIAAGASICCMADNGSVLVLVDGTTSGYAINLSNNSFGQITDPAFQGADRVEFLDTFFLFNKPNTPQFYISLSTVTYDMLTGTTGRILTGTISAGGSGYVTGTYTNVALTGGTGTGAVATVGVTGGIVTSVTLTSPGQNYAVGDVLSAAASSLGGSGGGFGYTAGTVATAFDALDFADKTGYADNIQTIITMHREVWLIGTLTTEIWYNAGAPNFPYQAMPGSFIEHGCVAKYSVARQDLSVYWLSQDMQGQAMVLEGNSYQAKRISTHAIENEIMTYPVVSDAVGFTYQQEGHVFYQLNFPTANKTWVYDAATSLWHERAYTDANGNLVRHRGQVAALAYGKNIVGDWQNGNLYQYDLGTYTDNGNPITRIRGFPHLLNDGKRVSYSAFVADMEVGTDDGSVDGTTGASPPQATLRWSNTRGASWGNPITQSMGASGQYYTQPQWLRLGIGRDRVFELSWSTPTKTALNGAFIEVVPCGT